MRKFFHSLLILSIVLVSMTPLVGTAEEQEELKVEQKASMGAEVVKEEARSSKFFEYRDVPNDFVFNKLLLSLEKKDTYFQFSGDRIRQNDAKYTFGFGNYGKYGLTFEYNKTPHRFSFEGRSLYVEAGPGDFHLSDQIQIDAQNAVGDGGENGRYNIGPGRSLISNFLAGAHPVDLELVRNKGSLAFTYAPSVPFTINLNASREERKGTRPIGASLGFSNVIELPEPIDYKTTNMDANVEYSGKWGSVRGGIKSLFFDNDVQILLWDNPYRITDQTYHEPSGAYSSGNGSVRGRASLPPSNSAYNFYVNGVFRVTRATRLSGSVSLGRFSQNEKLLPFTINSALTPEFAGALEAPAATLDAKANISSFNFSLNSKVVNDVYLNAGYRFYNFANKTHALEFEEGYARLDQVWEDVPVESEPLSYQQSRLFAKVRFNILKQTSLNLGYTYSSIMREGHGHGENEDEDKTSENTLKASLDTHLTDWMLFRMSYLHGIRKWSLEGKKDIYIPGFRFKRYFQADRDRDALNMLIDFSFMDNLGLTLTYMLGKDDYPNSDYGLRKNDFSSYGVDLSYALNRDLSLFGFYAHERYEGNQASRRSGAEFSTNPTDDWTAALEDKVETFGGGVNTSIIKDKLYIDAFYTYSKTTSSADLFSPPGGSPDVAINFDENLDTTTLHILRGSLRWKMQKNIAVVLGYWYEQYELEDINRIDWRVDMIDLGGAIYLGALEPRYKYHVGYLKFIWSW